jgi:hypothetical protein
VKNSTPILAAVARMHRDDDNARDPYNTVRPLDVVAWEAPTAPVGADAPMGESVTMWTDENGLDCYTNTLALEDKS